MSKPFGVNPMQARINSIGIESRIGTDGILKAARNIANAPPGSYKPNRAQRRHELKTTKKEKA